jgi:predicted cupin superfamily sugar epimerase
MTTHEADRLIARLALEPHPEGGHYRQTWAGPEAGGRASGTAILFLLRDGERSHWHRVDADELWLFHAGTPLTLRIEAEGGAAAHRLGPDPLAGDAPQVLVPAHRWQSAETRGGWALVSCTVTPGFRFEGFELAPAGFDLPAAGGTRGRGIG